MQISAKPDTSSRPLELAFTLSLSGQVPQSRGRRAVPARGRRKAAGRLRARQCRQHMHAGGGARFLSRPPSDRHSRPAGGGGGRGLSAAGAHGHFIAPPAGRCCRSPERTAECEDSVGRSPPPQGRLGSRARLKGERARPGPAWGPPGAWRGPRHQSWVWASVPRHVFNKRKPARRPLSPPSGRAARQTGSRTPTGAAGGEASAGVPAGLAPSRSGSVSLLRAAAPTHACL